MCQFNNILKNNLSFQAEAKSKWLCNKIELRNLDTGRISIFNGSDWVNGSGTVQLMSAHIDQKLVDYKIEVKTSDIRGCGTDANVVLQLTGENGNI